MNQILADQILNGTHDSDLEEILELVQLRRRLLADQVRRSLTSGDKVRFASTVRPQYLAGLTATVLRVTRAKVVVRIDAEFAGRFTGKEVTVPPVLLEAI